MIGFDTIFLIAILIISVVIHEVAHGYAAAALGDPTAKLQGRLTLNPLAHVDPLGSIILPLILALLPGSFIFGWAKPVPYNPYNLRAGRFGPALVAIAGPLANIVIAIVFGIVVRVLGSVYAPAALSLASMIVVINLMLAVFNLIPVPPLDGSKILFALLPWRFRWVETAASAYQLVLIVIVLLLADSILVPIVSGAFVFLTGVAF